MRNQTLLAPGEPVSDVTVHVVLDDFGPLGRAYVETDEVDADEETIIENILTGQYSHPLRVVAFNAAEGWARDVTEDIARAVLSRASADQRSIGKASQDFLNRALRDGDDDGRLRPTGVASERKSEILSFTYKSLDEIPEFKLRILPSTGESEP